MTYANPSTFVAGNVLTAAQMNVLANNDRFLHGPPTVRVEGTTNTTAAQNTNTPVKFGTERWDTNACWSSTANTRLFFNTAGKYHVGGSVTWANTTAGTYRQLAIRLNGSSVTNEDHVLDPPPETGSVGPRQNLTTLISASTGDYVELIIQHDVAAGLSVVDSTLYRSPNFWAIWVSS